MSTHAQGPVGRRRVAAGAVGVAAAGTAYRRRPPPPGHQPARRRRPHAVRLAALGADHRGRRRRRRPARRGRRVRRAPGAARSQAPELTVVFVHGYSLNLDSWHFQRAAYRGLVRTVFYDQRSHGRSGRSTPGPRDHRAARPRPASTVLDTVVPRGPGRAGRPLDGRDDDHRAGRGAPRAVRRPDRRRRR